VSAGPFQDELARLGYGAKWANPTFEGATNVELTEKAPIRILKFFASLR